MMLSPHIKILISQKKYSKLLSSDIFTPIQTGCALTPTRFHGMLHDDEGENISQLNAFFCELTAIYWAWKNYDKLGAPDYIGFMHHRRHFIFNEHPQATTPPGYVEFQAWDADYLRACSLCDAEVRQMLVGYDAIIPKPIRVGRVYDQYAQCHRIADYDLALQLLHARHPEMQALAEQYNRGLLSYAWLMGIYKKEVFFRYCEWLFGLLLELYPRLHLTEADPYQARACGFIAERLTGMYFLKLRQEGLRMRELHVSLVHRTEALYLPELHMPPGLSRTLALMARKNRLRLQYCYYSLKYALSRKPKHLTHLRLIKETLHNHI